MSEDRESRVRQRAYELWELAGKPHGRHDEHWHKANAELAEPLAPVAPKAAAAPKGPMKTMAAAVAQPLLRRKK